MKSKSQFRAGSPAWLISRLPLGKSITFHPERSTELSLLHLRNSLQAVVSLDLQGYGRFDVRKVLVVDYKDLLFTSSDRKGMSRSRKSGTCDVAVRVTRIANKRGRPAVTRRRRRRSGAVVAVVSEVTSGDNQTV